MRLPQAGLAMLVIASCAQAPDAATQTSAIIGGHAVAVGTYPTVVALYDNGVLCTGTLVAPNLVVTAAHCLLPSEVGYTSQDEVTKNMKVIFDDVNLNMKSGMVLAASLTAPHPEFNPDQLGTHDIGIVVLATPVTDRQPTPVNRAAMNPATGDPITLVGFGLTNAADPKSAGVLNVLTGKRIVVCDPEEGANTNLICFDESDGSGSCNGDSGGPAFLEGGSEPVLAGMTSFGDKSCAAFTVYTRLSAELSFLDQYLPAPDAGPPGEAGEVGGGGCGVASGGGGGGFLALVLGLVFLRRRR